MTYYHVRITPQGSHTDEVKTDLDAEALDRQFLEPYRTGSSVTVNGKTFTWDRIERIRISASEEDSSELKRQIAADRSRSQVVAIGGPSMNWRAANRAQDVTDQYITGPPGVPNVYPASAPAHGRGLDSIPNSVFVVAGRDNEAIRAVVSLLRALGLRIVEWEHAVARTGLPNPFIGDVVDEGLRMAQAVVVLLTPDDLVTLRPDLTRDSDGPEERAVRGQARPNVYYEAGFADALGRERTVIVEVGVVKSFSDSAGRHAVRYDGSAGKRNALAERLRTAGVDVDTSGEEWLHAGDVTNVLQAAAQAIDEPTFGVEAMASRGRMHEEIEEILTLREEVHKRSDYEDLSDLPDEALNIVVRAQAIVHKYARGTSYLDEATRVLEQPAHIRLPVLMAILRALRADEAQ